MLSGYAYLPPVETVLVPQTETSLLTGNSPRYRRKPRSKLNPHFHVVYPLPPASPLVVTRERPKLVAVRTSLLSQRREPWSVLRRPVVVTTSAAVELTPRLALAPSSRLASVAHSRLRSPVVINAAVVTVVYYGPLVRLAKPIPRRRTRPTYVYPIVVFRQRALGWTAVNLVRTPRPIILSSVLRAPVVVNP